MSNRYRLPVFTDEILSSIIFGMENQDVDYYLNVKDGTLHSDEFSDEKVPSLHLVELPPWHSSDGFQMMVNFTNACSDPKLQQDLAGELNSRSRGVFRRFRDVLARDKENLHAWYDYKDARMKAYVKSWYRDNYERLFRQDSAEDDLLDGELLADFEIEHLDKLDNYSTNCLEYFINNNPIRRKTMDAFKDKEAFIVRSGERTVGTLIYEKVKDWACILYYHIDEKDRGNGLFSLMFDMFNRELERHQITRVQMPFGPLSTFFRKVMGEHDVDLNNCEEICFYSPKQWNEGTLSSEFAYVL